MNNSDRIEAYLLGQMTASEAQSFEQELAQDSSLAQALKAQEMEHRAMELLLQNELRANLNAWKAEKASTAQEAAPTAQQTAPTMQVSRRNFWRIAAAASVVLLIGFFNRNLFLGNDAHNTALNALGEGLSMERGAVRGDTQWDAAAQAYQRKDYRATLDALERLDAPEYQDQIGLLKGECQLRLGEYAAAIAQFKGIVDTSKNPVYLEQAEWGLLLAYYSEGKHPEEVTRLRDKILADGEHPFYGKAKGLK